MSSFDGLRTDGPRHTSLVSVIGLPICSWAIRSQQAMRARTARWVAVTGSEEASGVAAVIRQLPAEDKGHKVARPWTDHRVSLSARSAVEARRRAPTGISVRLVEERGAADEGVGSGCSVTMTPT